MNAFLAEVTRHLIEAKGLANLADMTIVVPTRRAMLFVKDCFRNYMRANGLQGPVQLPQMTSLAQLFDDLSPRYKADEIQLVCTLYRVYCDVLREATKRETDLPLDVFYGWGRQLVQDFSYIDKAYPLVMPQDFLRNTASARKLEHLEIDEEVRERLLALVSTRENNVIIANSKRREFEVIWENLPLIYERFQAALGVYGYEGARMQAALEHWDDEAIQRRLKGRQFVFAGFNYLVPAEKKLMHLLQDAGQATFYWDYPDKFTANTKAFRWIITNAKKFTNALPVQTWQPKNVEVICAASAHGQAQYAYEWLRKTHQRGERSAVVICDESALEQVVYALPVDADDDQQPRFKHINITKGFPMRQTDVFAQVMQKLTDQQTMDIDALMPEMKAVQEGEEVHMTWHEMLDCEARFQMRVALTRFKKMLSDGLIPPIPNQRTLRLLLRRYLEGLSFPFHGEPLADVQVTGVLETRAMDFDNVLLLNVEEGIVPNVSADLSYLPYYLRKAYGLQTHEESTDVYAYNFFRLIYRAKNVTMLFTGSESKNNKKTMSRFLRQIMASGDFQVTKKILTESNTLAAPVLPVRNYVHKENPTNCATFSPSALNLFRNCRMQFYLKYVAGIKEPEEKSLLLERNEIGTLVHDAMQELYKRYASPADVPEQIPFDELEALKVDGNHPLELSAMRMFIVRIVQNDKQLAREHDLRIIETESPAYMRVDVEGVGSVQVGGRIDRVDKLDGVTRIIDYKTGSYKDDYDWQTRIYRAAYMDKNNLNDVQAVLYLCKAAKADEEMERIVEPEPNFMNELKELLGEVVQLMKCDISALPEEEFQALFADKADKCDFCPYKILCGRA